MREIVIDRSENCEDRRFGKSIEWSRSVSAAFHFARQFRFENDKKKRIDNRKIRETGEW
jgi:hypothetical protein